MIRLKKILAATVLGIGLMAGTQAGTFTPQIANTAEAGSFNVQSTTVEVDDSSVYRVGDYHVRVAFRIHTNWRTGAYTTDVADVVWGHDYGVTLQESYQPAYERELKYKLSEYCRVNY